MFITGGVAGFGAAVFWTAHAVRKENKYIYIKRWKNGDGKNEKKERKDVKSMLNLFIERIFWLCTTRQSWCL